MRSLLKTLVPNRALVSTRFALSDLSEIPLVAVPLVTELVQNLMKFGYGRSIAESQVVDVNGEPLPWYTYPMIEYLGSFDFSDSSVFEYGCGNSTLWWAKRAKVVVSVEDNREWFSRVSASLRSVIFAQGPEYVRSIDGMYDLIIVDGTNRFACSVEAIKHLNPGGAILVDNSDCLPKTTKFLRSQGLFEIAMNGFSALASRSGRTSLFISHPPRFRFKPHQPSLAGDVVAWEENDADANKDVQSLTNPPVPR